MHCTAMYVKEIFYKPQTATLKPRRPYGTQQSSLGRLQLRNHEQTSQRFPVRNAGETWRVRRSWEQGASREAWSQRPLPVRLWTQVLSIVAYARVVTMAAGKIPFFRE